MTLLIVRQDSELQSLSSDQRDTTDDNMSSFTESSSHYSNHYRCEIFFISSQIFFVRKYFPWLYYGTLNHWRPRSWFSFFDVPLQTGLQRDSLLIKQIISCSTSKGNFRNSAPRHQREMFHCKTSK